MNTVTYSHAPVAEQINQHYLAVHLNMGDPGIARAVFRQFRPSWLPTVVFLEHHGIEVRRTVGYLPPEQFLPELIMARAHAALLNGRYGDSLQLFQQVADAFPAADAAPEALFFAGVAAYRMAGKAEMLARWEQLRTRYPHSSWWTRASYTDEG